MKINKKSATLIPVALVSAYFFGTPLHEEIRTSKAGLELILNYEQCSSTAYLDSVGVLTDGCGNTHQVITNRSVTIAEMSEKLKDNILEAEQCVNEKLDGEAMNDNQFSASVSLVYNVGCKTVSTNSKGGYTWFRKYALAHDWKNYCPRFNAFNKAGGKPLKGLTIRRQAEDTLCETPIEPKE